MGRGGGSRGARGGGGSGGGAPANTPQANAAQVAAAGQGGANANAPAPPQAAPTPNMTTATATNPVEATVALRDLQQRSPTLEPRQIDAEVKALGRFSAPQLKEVQRQFLGVALGGSKKAMLELIAKRIHDFRDSHDRVEEIRNLPSVF